MKKAPGRADRTGVSMMELADMFPTDEAARLWFEAKVWPQGRYCPRCGSMETVECKGNPPMPYWCPACKRHFSVRIGTVMERSKIPLRKWVWAIYLHLTSLKGVSSMKLHRDIAVTQKTAWFMLQRIRKAFDNDDDPPFAGPVEVDEAYFGGKEANKHASKKQNAGRGTVGKTAVVGAKDRPTNVVKAKVVRETTKLYLQSFITLNTDPGAVVYTDEAAAYKGIPYDHETVNHSVGEFVRGMAHTNGMESFWATLRRAYKGVYHKISPKHLQRYVGDFAGKHGIRGLDTLPQMAHVAAGMVGKRLPYRVLIADNGWASGARA